MHRRIFIDVNAVASCIIGKIGRRRVGRGLFAVAGGRRLEILKLLTVDAGVARPCIVALNWRRAGELIQLVADTVSEQSGTMGCAVLELDCQGFEQIPITGGFPKPGFKLLDTLTPKWPRHPVPVTLRC
jgi:hypothetical protein